MPYASKSVSECTSLFVLVQLVEKWEVGPHPRFVFERETRAAGRVGGGSLSARLREGVSTPTDLTPTEIVFAVSQRCIFLESGHEILPFCELDILGNINNSITEVKQIHTS